MASNKNRTQEPGTGADNGKKSNRSGSHKPKNAATRNANATALNGIQWTPDLIQTALDVAISQFMGSAARANRTGVTLGTTNVFELYGWNFQRCSAEYRGRGMGNSNQGGGTTTEQQGGDLQTGTVIPVDQQQQSNRAAAGSR